MAIHAAMVDRMDREIGRVLDQLRAMDALDEHADPLRLRQRRQRRDHGPRRRPRPGRAARLGAPRYLCLGPGWSTVGNTPFRRHKTWVHEGGIATPLIVHWPRGIAARGELRHDARPRDRLVPTILELAGVQPPATWHGSASAARPAGASSPRSRETAPSTRDVLWWLHEGNRAIRVGDWKLVAARADGGAWELYDLGRDRAESHDLARDLPWKARELARLWTAKAKQFAIDAGYRRAQP